jgi:hypothetical protein
MTDQREAAGLVAEYLNENVLDDPDDKVTAADVLDTLASFGLEFADGPKATDAYYEMLAEWGRELDRVEGPRSR